MQATETAPWPFRLSGTVYDTATPTVVMAVAVTGSGQVSSGGSAITGGGGGVGAVGVVLHPKPQISASSVRKTLEVATARVFSS